MKLAVGSCTYSGSHSLMMVQRHVLDWRLQTDPRWRLSLLSDGPWEAREDRLTPNEIDFGPQVEFIEYPKRRKAWGAYCRQEWLQTVDPEEFPYVYFCCADDQIAPIMLERVLQEAARFPELVAVMFQTPHHHYTYGIIPLGVGPYLNRCDWASGIIKTPIAKEANINFPEEFGGDGLFWQDCLKVSGGDASLFRVLDCSLVFKN